MRTTVERPLRRLMTRTRVFMGSFRCAAVSAYMLKCSPLAVRCPCCSRPYQDALPSSTRTTPSRRADGGGISRTVDVVPSGTVLAQPAADASAAKATTHSHRALAARGCKRLLPQLVSRRPVAQRRARLFAVPPAEDVAQIGNERERVGVLLGVA